MPDPVQGLPNVEPAAPSQGLPPQEPTAPQIDLTPYLPDAPQVPPPAQGAVPPPPVQGVTVPPAAPPDPATHFQSLYNQELAKRYELEQRLQSLTQAPQAPAPPKPRPDPNTDWAGYMEWTIQENNRQLLQQFREAEQKNWANALQQASDMEWQRQHQGVDINQVRGFAQSRGISNLDDAYTLMSLPQVVNQVRTAASNQVLNQFRQPVAPIAQPIRPGAGGSGNPIGLSFDKLAVEFQQSHGKAYDSWPPELQSAFDREWALREASRGNGSR